MSNYVKEIFDKAPLIFIPFIALAFPHIHFSRT